ncbi:CTR copper uptake transporter [Mycena belliarum]|uniref:Copper transport protein n=1 Tax=Mycena belliarum TaxID=1033014 RepID=A0AAD6TPF3_9AGAR|nr:CTR copper uptake transporter [Mycena belliae]
MVPATILALGLALCAAPARAAENGMDMSMDGGMSMAVGTMMTTLHFSLGDTLWFTGWVPQTKGALAGACVGLFILAVVDRWVAAVRRMCEEQWMRSTRAAAKQRDAKGVEKGRIGLGLGLGRVPPPLVAHDVMRGVIHALQALLGYAIMLAVMTFQGGFIIAIAGGLGVGEALYGRYGASAGAAH